MVGEDAVDAPAVRAQVRRILRTDAADAGPGESGRRGTGLFAHRSVVVLDGVPRIYADGYRRLELAGDGESDEHLAGVSAQRAHLGVFVAVRSAPRQFPGGGR